MCEICKSLHELPWRLFSDECSTLLVMMDDIRIGKKQQLYVIKKMINIAIRATYYYIFCCRNRNWDSPDLMQFWFLFFSFFFLFIFFFFLNNPISSSICKLIYNCTFKNTNKVSIPIIIIFFFSLPPAKTPNLTVFLEKIVLKWNVTLLNMRNQNCTSEAVLLISHTLTTTTTTKQIS